MYDIQGRLLLDIRWRLYSVRFYGLAIDAAVDDDKTT
jgi:hypothetical protein